MASTQAAVNARFDIETDAAVTLQNDKSDYVGSKSLCNPVRRIAPFAGPFPNIAQ